MLQNDVLRDVYAFISETSITSTSHGQDSSRSQLRGIARYRLAFRYTLQMLTLNGYTQKRARFWNQFLELPGNYIFF